GRRSAAPPSRCRPPDHPVDRTATARATPDAGLARALQAAMGPADHAGLGRVRGGPRVQALDGRRPPPLRLRARARIRGRPAQPRDVPRRGRAVRLHPQRVLRLTPRRTDEWEVATLVVVTAALAIILRPDLWFRTSTLSGGDFGAHVWAAS